MKDFKELANALREWSVAVDSGELDGTEDGMLASDLMIAADAIEELSNPWISVKDRLPEKPYGCLLIVWDFNPMSGEDFLNHLPYFAGWDGEQWNDENGMEVPFEVVYWMPLPEPPKGEE